MPPIDVPITSDGITLEIKLSDTPRFTKSITLFGLLDTGADILIVDESLKEQLVDLDLITEQPMEELSLNGDDTGIWQINFYCPKEHFGGQTMLTFCDLKGMGIAQDALIGRSCLAYGNFRYIGNRGIARF